MKRLTAVLLSVMVLFAVSAMLFADEKGEMEKGGMGMMGGPGMEGKMMMGPKMVLSMASEFNLTAEQMDKLKKLSADMPVKGSMKEEMTEDRDALKAEMEKDAPDQAKIDSMIDKMADKHKAEMKTRIHNALAVSAILTKEQKEILKKKGEEKKEKREKMKGKKDK